MPALTITVDDLEPFADIPEAKAEAMIVDALALAEMVAPCLFETDLDPKKAAAAKAIVRGAILRWADAGTGAVTSRTSMAFSETIDTRQVRKGMFWPSEVTDLQDICKADSDGGGAWSYDTVGTTTIHADTCSLRFGATYCSCGADIAGYPLWEPQP